MAYIEMDPELVWKAIEGYENELATEWNTLETFYRQFRCPRCGGKCQKEASLGHAFADSGTMNPRNLLRCIACNFLLDPHSGLVVEMGKPLVHAIGVEDRWSHLKASSG